MPLTIEVAEISPSRSVLDRADEQGAVIPLMGPTDPGSVTPLMGPADHGIMVSLTGPADPGTATPLMLPSR